MQCRWRYAPFGRTASLLPIQAILPQQPFGVAVGLLATLEHQRARGKRMRCCDDRHVVAAAIRAKAQVIVTFNEKDFPAAVLEGRLFAPRDASHP
jgi:hypothetical protein